MKKGQDNLWFINRGNKFYKMCLDFIVFVHCKSQIFTIASSIFFIAELFHQLSQALEVLTDAAARAAYDKICAAKKQAEERNKKLDDKRKKIKLDLEARERRAEAQSQEEVRITRTLEEEIARLREEGSRQLEEEQRLIREQIQREKEAEQQPGDCTHRGGERYSQSNITPKLKVRLNSYGWFLEIRLYI
ncbi:hypothetical protein XENOCAPTIV_023223 [Xenoophorus captivus]|uniref:Uncharacterized protein n=1 Tax=Xenoophorus captivus TaxID=1517983 RepID=A0ABV0QWA9_9TELE